MELNKEIINDQTILKFELDTIKGYLFENSFERWVPGCTPNRIHEHHIKRYLFAIDFAQNKNILDIACGAGYGAFLLASEGNAKSVVGVDLSERAIDYGNAKYPHPNIKRIKADAQIFSYESKFEVVTCFETIEHLPDYKAFLKNLKTLLNEDAVVLISTPIVHRTRTTCDNPYHVIEWAFHDFHDLLKEYFQIEKIYIQNIGFKQKFNSKSISDRIVRKLLRSFKRKIVSPTFFEWKNQYSSEKIHSGYQVVVCKNE